MTETTRDRRCYGLAPLSLGAAAMLLLVVVGTPNAEGQAKDEAPKADKKETKELPDPELKFDAKVRDILAPGVGGVEQVAYINELIEKGWRENKIQPSARCTDYEFIRRASLDIIGRIATPEEIRIFLADPPERRRSLLIERLLKNPEFGENFANIWTVMLLTRSGSQKIHQEQLRDWLTTEFNEPIREGHKNGWADTVTELLTAEGVTNENPAVNFILHHLGDEIKGDTATNGRWDMVPVTSRTTRLFLGLRTQCVQCHDHPFNGEWEQKHFWGINAFFRTVDTPRGRPQMMVNQKKKGVKEAQRELRDNPNFNVGGLVQYERRNATVYYTKATFLDGKKPKLDGGTSRRKELARFIVTSPYFGKVFVNRMWHHFFGKSLTKDTPDDFGDHNPPTHPELLDRLAEDWTSKYNHDPKALVRWICNSRAYGLSSVANKYNDKPEDEVFFARMLLKPMSPEQLFDSLMTATAAKASQDKNERGALRSQWLDQLVVNFGNDEGEEGTFNGTVVQALMLMNGREMNEAIMDPKVGTVAEVARTKGFTVAGLQRLYLAALNRPPTQKELNKILNDKTFGSLVDRTGKLHPGTPISYYQDIFWSLLNSAEFILNH
ncbi:MAG: DUF1549 and DUF1553 domain-containing protein [Gemmataceae bacterium]|nr:DUF1549 and DUF1553 domain-containing protein [Gemmataceae bacterium]